MPKGAMSLYLINQVGKLLNSNSDLIRSINSVLVALPDYLPVRNPVLLIRDRVINKFFIDLSPELTEEQKTKWNQQVSGEKTTHNLKFQHQMVLYPDEVDVLDLPKPENLERLSLPKIIQPVTFKHHNLPLAILSASVTEFDRVGEAQRIFTFIADMLALAMVARGVPVAEIEEAEETQVADVPVILKKIVAESESMLRLASVIKKVASSKATILIQGESGTGKELIAQAIHDHSLHRKAPFIGVNCAALSDNLLESELFGHEKGAFTGANAARKGRFELADGGTLFLDEIGDTSLGFQTKILRVLQEGQFERLGGNDTIHVEVRILCATNVDLEQAIADGNFREDLYYRLNVVNLFIPPLRERKEDIPHLINFFLSKLNRKEGKNIQIKEADLDLMSQLDWPGNIRELENKIHSGFLMEQGGFFHFETPKLTKKVIPNSGNQHQENATQTKLDSEFNAQDLELEEKQSIEQALNQANGIQVKAAQMLGISLRQLRYRIKKYNIVVRKLRL